MPTYNIPASMTSNYSNDTVIIRSEDASELVEAVERVDRNLIEHVQLLGACPELAPLSDLDPDIPVEIVLKDAEKEAEYLHLYANSSVSNPKWISINTAQGFVSAVKTATSLGIETCLIVHQPDEALVNELDALLDLYLHSAEVEVPIEFFHSLLLAFCQNDLEESMWLIQREDPARDRYVLDNGSVVISSRLPIEISEISEDFLDDYRFDLMARQGECSICPYFTQCVGYFKFPDETYSCEGVKKIFSKLKEAANEIKAFQAQNPQKGPENYCAEEECDPS
jgi:RNAse (barnase) inhibitor barstar